MAENYDEIKLGTVLLRFSGLDPSNYTKTFSGSDGNSTRKVYEINLGSSGSGVNIYNSDGTIENNRQLFLDGKFLSISSNNPDDFSVIINDVDNTFTVQESNNGSGVSIQSISGHTTMRFMIASIETDGQLGFSGQSVNNAATHLLGLVSGDGSDVCYIEKSTLAVTQEIFRSGTNIVNTTANSYGLNNNIVVGEHGGPISGTVTNSVFFGYRAGITSGTIFSSIFMGEESGNGAGNTSQGIMLGQYAGSGAGTTFDSIFIGSGSGQSASGSSNIFIGSSPGVNCSSSSGLDGIIGIGNQAGRMFVPGNPNKAIFIGNQAGYRATNAQSSIMIGHTAGTLSASSVDCILIGRQAASSTTNVSYSVMLGTGAGQTATNSQNSIMIGQQAGYVAGTSSNCIFIGHHAGDETGLVSNKINIASTDNDWSILIGRWTRNMGFKNSVLLGGSTSGSYIVNTKDNQFMLAPNIINARWRSVDYEFPSSQGTTGSVLSNDGTGVLSWKSSYSGRFDPNISNLVNLSNTTIASLNQSKYFVVANMVTMNFIFDGDVDAGGSVSFDLDLPVSSNVHLDQVLSVIGMITVHGYATTIMAETSIGTANKVTISFTAPSATSVRFRGILQYPIDYTIS